MNKLVNYNDGKLNDSYWIPFQIISSDSICDVTSNNKLYVKSFFKIPTQMLIKDFLTIIIESYFISP